MKDQFIAGHGCLWKFKCGPMWFIISLDPPPSTWRREDRLSDKLTQTRPAGRQHSWHAIPEQCMVVEFSARAAQRASSQSCSYQCRCSLIYTWPNQWILVDELVAGFTSICHHETDTDWYKCFPQITVIIEHLKVTSMTTESVGETCRPISRSLANLG